VVRPCVQGDGCLGERVDVDGADMRGPGLGRDDRDETAPGREVEDGLAFDLVRVRLQPPCQRQPAGPREGPIGDRGILDLERRFRRVPHGLHRVGEMEADTRHAIHVPESRVPLDERAPMRPGQASR
jgi:hypothetical protein